MNNGIWAISEKRLLLTAGDGDLDKMIRDRGDWQDFDLAGDFTLCPLSRFKQGYRRTVTLVTVSNPALGEVLHCLFD